VPPGADREKLAQLPFGSPVVAPRISRVRDPSPAPVIAKPKRRGPRLIRVIDLAAARAAPEAFRSALARKGGEELFDRLLEADGRWRAATTRREEARAEQKRLGKPSSPEEIERARALKAELQRLDGELAESSRERQELWDRVPNPPDATAPDGWTEEDAVELRRVGEPRDFGFDPADHLDLGSRLGWFDSERGARVSGSRFVYRMGDAALLELALYRFALDRLVSKGFVPVLPPVLVREQAMYGTGFLPTDDVNIYYVDRDELYLTGTSEVALAGLHMGEILDEGELPLRYAGYSTCFRREAGAAGKDTRGIFRVHQFDKVEMFSFTRPEDSVEEHEHLLSVEEELVQELGIPYRVVNIAAGDLGAMAAKKYDIEAWFPGQLRYREITSTSNTTDYQTRRLEIRYRGEQGTELAHTLNGTAVTARALVAIIENFQDEGGSVAVPPVLTEFGAPDRAAYSSSSSRGTT
jgi:seryl-tRNA synthetase